MSDDYKDDIELSGEEDAVELFDEELATYILTDDDGSEHEFRHVDTIEYNDEFYVAMAPMIIPVDDEFLEIVIMKVVPGKTEDDDDMLIGITDENELDKVFEIFEERYIETEE